MSRPIGVRNLGGVAEITSLSEVRAAAKDWQRFSSRVQGDPDVRAYPQLPLEVDPPEHGAYRAILDPILGRRAVATLVPARARLREDPQRLQLAIEEYLRYFSPNTGMERRATVDVGGGWGSARAGEIVILGWGAANHDPQAFAQPGEIRLDRRPNPHLAFGSGPHTCIGIHLARLEVRVFLEELLEAVPAWRLGDGVDAVMARLAADQVPTLFSSLPLMAGVAPG